MFDIPGIIRKKTKPHYKKPESVKLLESMAYDTSRKRYPNVPDYALTGRSYRDDTANGLTACIVAYMTQKGAFASRVNNGGVYDVRLKKYRPGTSKKGLPDVLGTYRGKSLFIEVKIGKDSMSKFQRIIEVEQQQAGGLYYVARNFTEFKNWFDLL